MTRDAPSSAPSGLDLTFAPRPWPFAIERRAEIDRHFAAAQRRQPALWNGRILLLHHHDIAGAVFRGAYFESDFASFLAWRDWDFPGGDVKNCFPMAAIRAADGPFLLGIQGAHTADAGKIYFVAGTPDPDDRKDGAVDLEGNLWREARRGNRARGARFRGGARLEHRPRRAAASPRSRSCTSRERAHELRARILANLACQAEPELSRGSPSSAMLAISIRACRNSCRRSSPMHGARSGHEQCVLAIPHRRSRKIQAAAFKTDDTAGLDKDAGEKLLAKGVKRLRELQPKLYAEHRWAVLVVLQGMDAAGKDGVITHVMSGRQSARLRGARVQATGAGRARPRLPLARREAASDARSGR